MRMGSVLCVVMSVAGAAQAQNSVSVDLTNLVIQNGVNQSRSSAPNTISPSFRYTYVVDGLVRGQGGVLGSLFPNPTPLAQVLETLSPGASTGLSGTVDNCSGAHPVSAPPTTQSGSQVVLGLTVNFAATLQVGIDASNVASFSITGVTLSPAFLVGSLRFTSGSVVITRDGAYCPWNCDASTTPPILNALDFSCFLEKYRAGDPSANCDCSTTPPELNALDFSCFLQRFVSGCP